MDTKETVNVVDVETAELTEPTTPTTDAIPVIPSRNTRTVEQLVEDAAVKVAGWEATLGSHVGAITEFIAGQNASGADAAVFVALFANIVLGMYVKSPKEFETLMKLTTACAEQMAGRPDYEMDFADQKRVQESVVHPSDLKGD